jgi:hypothetical protein
MKILSILIAILIAINVCNAGEGYAPQSPLDSMWIDLKIPKQANGYYIEQNNIMDRIREDNRPGMIQYFYSISPMTGDVLIYSTVSGKVTSSHKRLYPTTLASDSDSAGHDVTWFVVEGTAYNTPEVFGYDGTSGDSAEYIFWKDVKGNLHQHFLGGGDIIHVSSQPLAMKKAIINLDLTNSQGPV